MDFFALLVIFFVVCLCVGIALSGEDLIFCSVSMCTRSSLSLHSGGQIFVKDLPAQAEKPFVNSEHAAAQVLEELDDEEDESKSQPKRVLVCSYYLPIIARRLENGTWDVKWDNVSRSPIPQLRTLMDDPNSRPTQVRWIGWPRVDVPEEEQDAFQESLDKFNCHAVFLPDDLRETYFNEFCKGILWPLFHYMMPTNQPDFAIRWEPLWQAYTAANMLVTRLFVPLCVFFLLYR